MSKQQKKQELVAALKSGKVPNLQIEGLNKEYSLLDHQKISVTWMILTPKCLLADSVGVGKTLSALGLLQWLKDRGQLSTKDRALVIVPAISVYGSWMADGFEKFVPDMKVAIGRGTKAQREKIYHDKSYEVLLTNYETVRNDVDIIEKMGFKYVVLDEADAIRNHETKSAKAVKRITKNAKRVVAMTATPIQNHLLDLHGIMEAVGLTDVVGTKKQFVNQYQKHELTRVFYNGKWHWKKVVRGYKNTKQLKERIAPYYLRRTYRDIDVKMPELQSQVEWLEMTPEQKKMYREAQQGFVQLRADSSVIELKAAALRLRQICTTTALIDDTRDNSCKFDWLVKQFKGDWQDEKVVLYSNWRTSIDALCARLAAEGIKYVVMTGAVKPQEREVLRQQFWNDPSVRVLLGTTAIEKSLNLQCAKIQVNLDLLWNASRHGQLAGRVHRIGSVHDDVYVFSTLVKDSIEEGMLKILQEKQALMDHMFDDDSQLFEKLSQSDLYKLITS